MSEITAIQFADYGPSEVLSARRIAMPQPGAGEVSIAMHAASVNPIDWKVRAGQLKQFFPVVFPMTTGRDGAGIVTAVGEGVDAALIGRRVCFLASRGVGTWAEQIVLPAALAVPIPDAMSLTDAAALPLAGLSAWAALVTEAQLGPGMRVLIHAAAGGVGTLAVQIARDRGAQVYATCSSGNLDYVRALGVDDVIAYDRDKFDERLSGLDVVLDPIGGEVHDRSYGVLREGGTLVCLTAAPFKDRGRGVWRQRESRESAARSGSPCRAGRIGPYRSRDAGRGACPAVVRFHCRATRLGTGARARQNRIANSLVA